MPPTAVSILAPSVVGSAEVAAEIVFVAASLEHYDLLAGQMLTEELRDSAVAIYVGRVIIRGSVTISPGN